MSDMQVHDRRLWDRHEHASQLGEIGREATSCASGARACLGTVPYKQHHRSEEGLSCTHLSEPSLLGESRLGLRCEAVPPVDARRCAAVARWAAAASRATCRLRTAASRAIALLGTGKLQTRRKV